MPGPRKKPEGLKGSPVARLNCAPPANAATSPPPTNGSVCELPAAPDWLDVEGVKEWNRVGPLLVAAHALHESALTMLGHYCAMHSHIIGCYRAHLPVQTSKTANLAKFANALGINYLSSQPANPGDGPRRNRFENNGRKPT